MSSTENKAEIRVGVVGTKRGRTFARVAASAGMKLVAICDSHAPNLEETANAYGVAAYRDYDEFLDHDMDAVILANYFHEHVPLALPALERGYHVMSETATCVTMAEGVELIRAVEKSGCIYMLAENCAYFPSVQEMTRLYKDGYIGEARYAEGEYIHPSPPEARVRNNPSLDHWRHHMPATYYCSHSIAPLMAVTDLMPTSVNALAIPYSAGEDRGVSRNDRASVILCRMENGAVFKLIQGGLSDHKLYYRFHGTRGMMETPRPFSGAITSQVRIALNDWTREAGQPKETLYEADFPSHGELARGSGHGGADFYTSYYFAQAIRTGEQPYLDVYRGVAMSAIGILGWRSALEDGTPWQIPDLRSEDVRKQWENDHWSPFPEHAGPGQPPSSIEGPIEPSAEALARAKEIWAKQ